MKSIYIQTYIDKGQIGTLTNRATMSKINLNPNLIGEIKHHKRTIKGIGGIIKIMIIRIL